MHRKFTYTDTGGFQVTILAWDNLENHKTTIKIDHRHRVYEEDNPRRGAKPEMVYYSWVSARYNSIGRLVDFSLNVDTVWPKKRGQQYAWGVDISPGSHLFLVFNYVREGDAMVLTSVEKGASPPIDLRGGQEGLIKPIEVPFPVLDRVAIEYNECRVPTPYVDTDPEDGLAFYLPGNVREDYGQPNMPPLLGN